MKKMQMRSLAVAILLLGELVITCLPQAEADEIGISVDINTDYVSIRCILPDTLYTSKRYTSLFKVTNLAHKTGGKECMNYSISYTIDGPEDLLGTSNAKCVNGYKTSQTGIFQPKIGGNYTVCGSITGTKQKDCKEVKVVDDGDYAGLSDEEKIKEGVGEEDESDGENKTAAKASNKKFYYEMISIGTITLGEPFITTIRIVNNENISHNVSIWSYLYRGSSCISGGREENMQSLEIGALGERMIELENMVMDADPGDYKLKVRLKKDDQKTTIDVIENVSVMGSAEIEDNAQSGAEDSSSGKSSGKISTAKKDPELRAFVIPSTYIITKTDKLYKSVSERSRDLAVWIMLVFTVLLVLLVWRKW